MGYDRNGQCWCGSGKKYKRCHLAFDERLAILERKGIEIPRRDMIKNLSQIEGIRESAKVNNGLLNYISENIRAGITTEDINTMAHEYTISHGAIPADLGYDGYPKSICTSVNEQVCHGIPNENVVLKNGDIINVDATTMLNGYYSDASRMYMIGEVSEEAKRLVQVTKECLVIGMNAIVPWESTLGDIGAAIQSHAESNGYSVVREYGGHGVGLDIHEDPIVSHVGRKGQGMLLVPGMVITIEPMINAGSHRIKIKRDDGWTVVTADGSLSAQWEHTLYINETGVEIISK